MGSHGDFQTPDPESEDNDQECALQFGLSLPTYSGPIGKPTTTVSIPEPPPPALLSPNPDTGHHCYNKGS